MRDVCRWAVGTAALLGAILAAPQGAAAQADRVAPQLIGPWYGQIEGFGRAHRLLDIHDVRPTGAGTYDAVGLYGWGDGSLVRATFQVTESGSGIALAFRAPSKSDVKLALGGDGRLAGTFILPNGRTLPMSLGRLELPGSGLASVSPAHEWLAGTWQGETSFDQRPRVLDLKQVLRTPDGELIATGQYGIPTLANGMADVVVRISSPADAAEIHFVTQSATRIALRAENPARLAGSFVVKGGKEYTISLGAGPAEPAGASGANPGERFPNFRFTDAAGVTRSLNDLRGKVVLINVWQHWCAWCQAEFPSIAALRARYPDESQLAILLVNGSFDPKTATEWLRARNLPLSAIRPLSWPLDSRKVPRNYILDRQGVVVAQSGYLASHTLFAQVDEAMKR